MPMYDFYCANGHKFTRFVKLADFEVMQLCGCEAPATRAISAPFVIGDVPPYTSPIDGHLVSGRAASSEDLRQNGCLEWEPGIKEDGLRSRAESEQRLDQEVEETIESAITAMPARKRERLEQETLASNIEIVRSSA